MNPYSNILFATDFTEESQKAAKRAGQLAKAFGADVSILHVLDEIPAYVHTYMGSADVEDKIFSEAKQTLAEIGKQLDVPASRRFVQQGPVKKEILSLIDANGIDLVVLGSHSKRGLSSLLGSTATAISTAAKCDVLIVRVD